jgi:membrane-associated phospholipid phosphatase
MRKQVIIFFAEYVVLFEGLLLFLLACRQKDTISGISLFISGTILLLVSVGITKVLKVLIRKKRPPERIEYFQPFDTYAFPSGHATGLLSVTFFMGSHSTLFGILALLTSFTILLARVKSHVHDGLDMFAGACVGILVTYSLMPFTEAALVPYMVNAFL